MHGENRSLLTNEPVEFEKNWLRLKTSKENYGTF
jgi:hypothetical protein